MSNLLLTVSIVLNMFFLIHILKQNNYIKNSIKQNTDAISYTKETLNHSIIKLSDNMDRHFQGMAGKINLLSGVLHSGEKGKKK